MLSHEVLAHQEQSAALEVAQFLADTVIILKREHLHRSIHRSLEIMKSRGQDFEVGKTHVAYHRRQGVGGVPPRADPGACPPGTAYLRHETLAHRLRATRCPDRRRYLRRIHHHGRGHLGAGKTVLGVQLLLEGALKQGKRGLLISLDEHPAQILRNAETLGLDLKQQVDEGNIQVFYDSPQELEIDAHFDLIIRTIEKHKIQRLLIDGMTSYSNAIGDQALYRDFIHSLVAYSKHNLMTTFFNYENPELFGVTHYMPDYAISSIVDNLILLNFVELGSSLRRAITVAKARGSEHQFVTREFTIGPGGISLLPMEEGKGPLVLPFQSYYSLLSRAPTRISPDLPRGGEGGALPEAT